VQVGRVVGAEEGPVALLPDPLHEQVGDPVGRVHVVGAAALVAGVLAQVEEVLDVEVPGLEVGAHGALALAALVDATAVSLATLRKGMTPWLRRWCP
jgi:hypothetical protein